MNIWRYFIDVIRGVLRGFIIIIAILLIVSIIQSAIEGIFNVHRIIYVLTHIHIYPGLIFLIVISSVANVIRKTFIGLVLNVFVSLYTLSLILMFLKGGVLETEYDLEQLGLQIPATIKVSVDIRILILAYFIMYVIPSSLITVYRYFELKAREVD